MARKKAAAHGGGHGWFVTFADLMGLLMSFFVMLVAFSNQDQNKLQIVAGSMRDAFGVQQNVRYSGIVEVSGLPTRPKLKNAERINPEEATANPAPEPHIGIGWTVCGSTRIERLGWPRRRYARRCKTCPSLPRCRSISSLRRPSRVSTSRSSIRTAARCSPMVQENPTNGLAVC